MAVAVVPAPPRSIDDDDDDDRDVRLEQSNADLASRADATHAPKSRKSSDRRTYSFARYSSLDGCVFPPPGDDSFRRRTSRSNARVREGTSSGIALASFVLRTFF